jgi:hypothetical protein
LGLTPPGAGQSDEAQSPPRSMGNQLSARAEPTQGSLDESLLGPPSSSYWQKRRSEETWKLREALLDGDAETVYALLKIDVDLPARVGQPSREPHHVRISGVVLHQGGSQRPYKAINGEYRQSDEMCNGRPVYIKESNQSIAMWSANAEGKLSWCVGPKGSVDGMSPRGHTWAHVERMSFGPEEAGGRAWNVYSYNSGAWEEQVGVRVENLDPPEVEVIQDRRASADEQTPPRAGCSGCCIFACPLPRLLATARETQLQPSEVGNKTAQCTNDRSENLPPTLDPQLSALRWEDDGGHRVVHYLTRGRCEIEYEGARTTFPVISDHGAPAHTSAKQRMNLLRSLFREGYITRESVAGTHSQKYSL